jgi:hypothetical protein
MKDRLQYAASREFEPLSEYGIMKKHLHDACFNINVAVWIPRKQINEVARR